LRLPKKGKYQNLERTGFLLPINVSRGKGDRVQGRGTRAFVPMGTEIPKELNANERLKHRGKLAEQAPFFTKQHTPRQKAIAEKLRTAGIGTEEFILSHKNGRAVFGKAGHALSTEEGARLFRRHFWDNTEKLEKMVAKMRSLGISHNHLHPGNITIDEKGNLRIIDLGKATMIALEKTKRLGKDWAFKKFYNDLRDASGTLFVMAVRDGYPDFRNHAFTNIVWHYPPELIEKIGYYTRRILAKGYEESKQHAQEMGGR